MAKRFQDKVVVVTGASSGIGREAAIQFAAEGARVVLAARRRDRIEEVAREIERAGGVAVAVPTDVADASQVQALIDEAAARFGRIDILVNNAGYGHQGLLEASSMEQARRLFEVNF